METFIAFFFTGPNWFWHFLLLVFLCYILRPQITINNDNNSTTNDQQGTTSEIDSKSSSK